MVDPIAKDGSTQLGTTRAKLLYIGHLLCNTEVGRLIVAILVFVIVAIFMAVCNQFSDKRWWPSQYKDIQLADRGFDIFPEVDTYVPANVFVLTTIIGTIIGLAFMCPTWHARLIAFRRVLWVLVPLCALRALTLSVTTLPASKPNCHPTLEDSVAGMLWVAMQMIPGTIEACTDDIYSGHTVFMITCAIQWRIYCRRKYITYFVYCYVSAGLYFIIASRLHYTVDVVLAIFITYAMFAIYLGVVDLVVDRHYFGIGNSRDKFEDKKEFEHVVYIPRRMNTGLMKLICWCDGLDLRMQRADMSIDPRWLVKKQAAREEVRAPEMMEMGRANGTPSVDMNGGPAVIVVDQ